MSERITVDVLRGRARGLEQQRVRAAARARLFGAEETPTHVGRFVLRRRLGAGAAGVVYAAHDPALRRDVAIKLVVVGAPADAVMLAEARALARVSHPSLLAIYEIGDDGGVPFIATELATGGTLREWLATEPPLARRLEILVAVARGLAEAHRCGLVHRDLKPDNVLLGADGRPRIADFGLAVDFGAVAGDGATPLPGTPAYMAPEQARGEAADPRSDQYAFCVVAHEVLFDARPEPTAPVPAGHPAAAIGAILARGRSPAPAARWPSMDALVEALEARGPRRRRRRWATAAAGLVGAITVGLVAQRAWPTPPAPAPAPTEADLDRALFLEVEPLLLEGRYDECARLLTHRARTDVLRNVWVQCAHASRSTAQLRAACAAWAAASPAPRPPDCAEALLDALALADAGEPRACAERLLAAPPSRPGFVALSRCTAQLGERALYYRQCQYQQRIDDGLPPPTDCGPPP
ncbi:MAG: serine/threonine-protein kinase [Kofleriaceae bacterium]